MNRVSKDLHMQGPPLVPEAPEGLFIDLAWASEEERAGSDEGSRMLFPLRTGVELFSDPTMPGAVARAKQAAILYDELIFETGIYEVSVAAGGSSWWWTPQEFATDERLVDSRKLQTPGTPFRLALGVEGSERMAEFINSPLVAAYASEYHTGILDELAPFAPGWVKTLTLGNKPPSHLPEGKLFRRQSRRDRFDKSLMPEGRRGDGFFMRRWIINTFNRDAIVASMVDASFNPTSLFAPMVERRGVGTPLTLPRDGTTALGLWVPSFGALPWENVIEFRGHPASAEARAMLRQFEEKAALEEAEDASAFLRGIEREVREALLTAVEELRPSWPKKAAWEVLKMVVGVEPYYGQLAGAGLTVGELGHGYVRDRRSWVAALMVLRRRSS